MLVDTIFQMHSGIGDFSKQWRLGRERVHLLVKEKRGVLKYAWPPRNQ
jgi:hypothetical protein